MKNKILALVLLFPLLLSGCGRQSAVITPVIQENQTAAGQHAVVTADGTVEGYSAAGYVQPGQIIAADLSITDFTAQPTAAPAAEQPEVDSSSGSMEHGDVTLGIVVGGEAIVHPLNCTYTDLLNLNSLVFESVVQLDKNLQPSPLLANRWYYSNGVWTFVLRPGIRFHNGETLTAYDVVASYQAAKANPDSYWYNILTPINDMRAIDDLTLEVKSNGPKYMMLYAMTFPVVQQNTLEYALPMGTGPYWYVGYEIGHSIRVEQNPLWWRRASGAVSSVVAICYRTTKAALTGMELGEIDALATDYPTAALYRSLEDRMTLDYSTNTYECIVPNLRDGILSDLNVRQAIMYALDRTSLGDSVYAGMVQESEVPVIPGSWIYDPQSAIYDYSPERALKILLDAGWDDTDGDGMLEKTVDGVTHPLRLNLITYDRGTTSTRTEAANTIARQLKAVGFDIQVSVGSQAAVVKEMQEGSFDLALCAFELNTIPYLQFLLGSEGNCNYSRYSSSDMDGYIADSYKAETAEEMREAMYAVQQLTVTDLPILGLFFRAGILSMKQPLGGLSGMHQGHVLRGLATSQKTG